MDEHYTKKLIKNIQTLATLVATATYAAAFNPPGGVWQDLHDATGKLPGDPIMRSTHHHRYVVFFYCNAAAFVFSLAVVVLALLVTARPEKTEIVTKKRGFLVVLVLLMLVAMLALVVAYGAGVCRDKLTVVWYCLLVPIPLTLFIARCMFGTRDSGGSSNTGDVGAPIVITSSSGYNSIETRGSIGKKETRGEEGDVEVVQKEENIKEATRKEEDREVVVQRKEDIIEEATRKRKEENEDREKLFRKLMVPLSMFALTITYVAGLSTPGGFWDSAEGGHRPGDAILKDRLHGRTLRGFLLSNTLAFVASLYGVSFVMCKSLVGLMMFIYIIAFGLLAGILAAYIGGSCRGRISIRWLTAACLLYMFLHVVAHVIVMKVIKRMSFWKPVAAKVSELMKQARDSTISEDEEATKRRQTKLVQLMATLAVAITYQAGLYPPGGLWPANADGHMAGDPILQTTNARRYKGFHYCNSVSFVASLLVMLLAQTKIFIEYHALEAAMILDLLGLIGAYAIGSCRDQVTTLYVTGLAGAAVVYVVVHVSYFTLDPAAESEDDDAASFEKMGGRFLFFAILVASITYQAGLTPPGGFLVKDDHQSGHHAGDPVLLYNYPRRYKTFFYCNSASFMLSIVLILLLVNRNHYMPAIRSHALTLCSVVSYVCLMGAFAAGSTQHLIGSFSIFVMTGVASSFCIGIVLWICVERRKKRRKEEEQQQQQQQAPAAAQKEKEGEEKKKEEMSRSVYLIRLAILVASATYPAGLDPPGGSWQSSRDGHDAGNPVMHDNRRQRYLAFFIGNTASFVASIMLAQMLLPAAAAAIRLRKLHESYMKGLTGLVSLQCLGFLVAYAAGSSRSWRRSAFTGVLVGCVMILFVIHVTLSWYLKRKPKSTKSGTGTEISSPAPAAGTVES